MSTVSSSNQNNDFMSVEEMDMFRIHLYNTLSGESDAAQKAPRVDHMIKYMQPMTDVVYAMCKVLATQLLDTSVKDVPGEVYCAIPVGMSLRRQVYDTDELTSIQISLQDCLDAVRRQLQLEIDTNRRGEGNLNSSTASTVSNDSATVQQLVFEIVKGAVWSAQVMPVPHAMRLVAESFHLKKGTDYDFGQHFPRSGVPYSLDVQKELSKWKEGESDCLTRQQVLVKCSLHYAFANSHEPKYARSSQEYQLIARTPLRGVRTVVMDPSVVERALRRGVAQEGLLTTNGLRREAGSSWKQTDSNEDKIPQKHPQRHIKRQRRGGRFGRKKSSIRGGAFYVPRTRGRGHREE